MNWDIEWSPRSVKDLERLDPQTADRVVRAIDQLAESGRGDVSHLHGADKEFRLRVGGWRVRFVRNERDRVILVLRVLPRGRAYRD